MMVREGLKRARARTQVVLKLIQPYTRIRIAFVAHQLNIEERDVEQLLVGGGGSSGARRRPARSRSQPRRATAARRGT